jgi:hypothetical protein
MAVRGLTLVATINHLLLSGLAAMSSSGPLPVCASSREPRRARKLRLRRVWRRRARKVRSWPSSVVIGEVLAQADGKGDIVFAQEFHPSDADELAVSYVSHPG